MTLEVFCRNCEWQGVINAEIEMIKITPCVRCQVSNLIIERTEPKPDKRKHGWKRHTERPCWNGARGYVSVSRKLKKNIEE